MKNTETSVLRILTLLYRHVESNGLRKLITPALDEPAQRLDQPDEDDDVAEHMSDTQEDCLNEVEMWQQLEHELYDGMEGGGDDGDGEGLNEIREEEAEAIAEASEDGAETSVPQTKEVHRFFPAGKIMHIVTYPIENENTDSDGSSSSSHGSENNKPPLEMRIGIFLTQRSLYSKVRLSQSMISDHFMPVYRRQIEKVIQEVEKDEAPHHDCQDSGHMI